MSDLCIDCSQAVRPLQHGISCDVCDKWQHRTCNTGISRLDYFKARKRLVILSFTCTPCREAQSAADHPQDTSMTSEPDTAADMSVVETTESEIMSSTMNSENNHGVTFNLDYSIGTASSTSRDNSMNIEPTTTLENTTADLTTDDDGIFDITRDGPTDVTVIQERSIGEPPMSTTIIEEGPTTFEVVEEGSERRRKKLVSSDGYSYCVKRETPRNVQWRCSVRRKTDICYASVTQRGDVFTPGTAPHNHEADALMKKKVVIKRDLKKDALKNIHTPAGTMVDEKMSSTFETGNFNLPVPLSLVRLANRTRQDVRPDEPQSLDFELNTAYLNHEFLVGDIRVGEERHLMFATQEQLHLLQQAKRWYLDGTFKVVSKPFYQLFSIHAFLKQGESMKQVPLMFVLMSKRRKQDYIAVLEKVVDILSEAPAVEGFVMDFEAGLWQALRSVFPGLNMKGCVFHWSQAILRRVGELGLKRTYEQREGPHKLIRKLLALPFLPGHHIKRAFEALRNKATTQPMVDLFDYVEDQWIESSLWNESEWSVYKQTVRTNNDTEGWHRRINAKAGRASLQLYVLLPLLLHQAKLVDIQHQLVSEGTLSRHRRERNKRMDGSIMGLWDKYDLNSIATEKFMEEVASVYVK